MFSPTFQAELIVADGCFVASRLNFDCTPARAFLGLPVNGRRIRFSENIFYRFVDLRIAQAWSIIDKAGIESQL